MIKFSTVGKIKFNIFHLTQNAKINASKNGTQYEDPSTILNHVKTYTNASKSYYFF